MAAESVLLSIARRELKSDAKQITVEPELVIRKTTCPACHHAPGSYPLPRLD